MEIPGIKLGRRFHHDQRHNLQQVALDHVHHGSGPVVIPAAAFEPELLVIDDFDPGDVFPVPERFEDPVGQTQPEDVEDCRLAHEVVHTESPCLGNHTGNQLIQLGCALPVAAERFLERQRGLLRQRRIVQGLHCRRRDTGWQREVDDRSAVGLAGELPKLIRRGDIGGDIAGMGQCMLNGRALGVHSGKRFTHGAAPLVVTPLLSPRTQKCEPPFRFHCEQLAYPRQKQAGCKISCPSKDDER